MRVLIVHNEYQQAGGEDVVLREEFDLLTDNGHTVERYIIRNSDVVGLSSWLATARQAAYNVGSRELLHEKITSFEPDIVHVHNFFPILSPSIYDACIEARVPVVQTLHNFRLLCPKATMYRRGRVCEICMKGSPYHAALYGCYRESRILSLMPARMVSINRRRGTWRHKVDRYIALTEFAKRKFIEGNLPADRIDVKPNFATPPATKRARNSPSRHGALFVGRISEEKGIKPLIDAWSGLTVPLRVVGEGPMSKLVDRFAGPHIEQVGFQPSAEVSKEMLAASFLVVPSLWYEGFALVLVEAFSHGLPVIASRLGSMAEIVQDGVTGLHVEPNDPDDLSEKVRWAHAHPKDMAKMGANARRVYQRKYTPQANYPLLMAIYDRAREHSRDRRMDPKC